MGIQLMMMYTYHINLEWSIHPKCFEALPIFRSDCLIKHIKGEKEYSLTCNFKNDNEIPTLKKTARANIGCGFRWSQFYSTLPIKLWRIPMQLTGYTVTV